MFNKKPDYGLHRVELFHPSYNNGKPAGKAKESIGRYKELHAASDERN